LCWCRKLLFRESDCVSSVGLEVLRRAKGAGVLLEETLDAVDRVMNDDVHRFGPVGARYCQGPPGSLGQLAIRLFEGTSELVVVRDRGNSHDVHSLFSFQTRKSLMSPGTTCSLWGRHARVNLENTLSSTFAPPCASLKR
jgi:hypothetical protein